MTIQEILSIGNKVTEMGFVLTIVYAIVVLWIVRLILKAFKRFSSKAIERNGKEAATTLSFFSGILKVALYALAVYLILDQFTAFKSVGNLLLGTSSVIGVAAALASQESMANMVGGIFLSIYQPCRVGDSITLPDKNITGRIKEISMRHTVILTANNTEVIIPNSIMNSAIIENRDRAGWVNNHLVFGISYSSNIDQAMEIMIKHAEKHALILDDRSDEEREKKSGIAKVVVINLGDYSVDLRLSFKTINAGDGFTMCCDLRKSIKEAFDEAGIEIPFPTTQILQ